MQSLLHVPAVVRVVRHARAIAEQVRRETPAHLDGPSTVARLAEAGIEGSVGTVGDSYDNALAETVIGLFKTEVVRRRGPWRNIDDLEFAALEWIDWFNRRRLLGSIGYVPPIEFEESYYRALETPADVAGLM